MISTKLTNSIVLFAWIGMLIISILAPGALVLDSRSTDTIRSAGMTCCTGDVCNCGDDCPGMGDEPVTCARTGHSTALSLTAVPAFMFTVRPDVDGALYAIEPSSDLTAGHPFSLEKPPRFHV
ncbi:hypothetical protein GF324_13470 [bacterium]|nr:hypothetical protein [bacterium]